MIIYKKYPQFDRSFCSVNEIKEFLQVELNDLQIFHIYQFADQSKRQDLITAILIHAMVKYSMSCLPTYCLLKIMTANTIKSKI